MRTISPAPTDGITRSLPDSAARDGRTLLDHDPAAAVLRRQAGSLVIGVARPRQRAVRLEELGVSIAMVRRVGVGGGDADRSQLRMVLDELGQAVAVAPQLEELADGQPGPVAERLAVHDERIDLD